MKKCLRTSAFKLFLPMALFLLIITSLVSLFTGCGGGGAAMETFPGSNVSLDGTIDWEGARTDHNGGNTLGSMFTPRELTTDEQCLGGSSNDVAHCIKPTDDGGYIIAGWSSSTDGDASGSGNHGGGDAWIIKYSSGGSIMWQKCYGGSEWDCAFSIDQTADGGYIFAGSTKSSDGDVQSRSGKTETDEDIWVVKLSPSGALVREQYIGDYGTGRAVSVCNAGDGYAVAAYTDYSTFVVKLDTTLTSTWSRYYGEGGDSSITSIIRASDGNYVCAGYTAANGGDTEGNHGGYDAWVMKLDPNGEPLWHRCVGGTSADRAFSIQQTAAGSYLVAGGTRSNSGDLAGKNPSYNDCCWVFRLDGTGNTIEWQNLINNGAYGCWGRSAQVSSDAGYIVAGYVYYTSQNYNGFIAKFDSSGTLSWVRAPGGSGPDYMYSVCEASGSYVAAGENNSYNTPGNHGGTDAFVARISGDITPSPSPSPTAKQIIITNAAATPEKFTPLDPSSEGKATISATVTAKGFTPTNLTWKLTITGSDNIIAKTYTGNGQTVTNISVDWDGKNDSGSYSGYDNYIFKLTVTCDENVKAETTGAVKIVPPIPTLTELTFNNTISIVDDSGDNIKPIYYEANGDKVEQNPVAISLANLTPIMETSSTSSNQQKATFPISAKGKCNLTLDLSPIPIVAPASYKVRIKRTDGSILINDAYATFDKQNKLILKDVEYTVPYAVQTIDTVLIDYLCVKNVNGIWTSIGDWENDVKVKPVEHIWVTFSDPLSPPFDAHGKNKARAGLLDIACYLAQGATTPEEARKKMTGRLYDWLKMRNFKYYPPHSNFMSMPNKPDETLFDYGNFMAPLYNASYSRSNPHTPPVPIPSGFWGCCKDVSAFYTLCCKAIGVNMKMCQLRPDNPPLQTYPVMSCGAEEFFDGVWRPAVVSSWPFLMHQVAGLDSLVWDSTLMFPITGPSPEWEYGFAIGVSRDNYKKYLVQGENVGWTFEFELHNVKWPNWK